MRVHWLAIVVVVSAQVACNPNVLCTSSDECAPGLVCMRVHPSPNDDTTACRQPCGDGFPPCGPRSMCFCPDSPTGGRCQVADRPKPTLADGGTGVGFFFCF